MKLQEMIEKGYKLRAWTVQKAENNEIRRIAVKLSKTVKGRERFYVVHSPQVATILSDVEFTEPVILKDVK